MKAGWQTTKLGDLCEVIAGQSPEGKFYNADGMGMAFYQGKKDFGEKFIEAPTTWTTQITKIAREGDILMSVRAPVGPVNFATGEICIGRGLAAIRSKAELNRDFLFYQLLHLQPAIAGREGAVFASINKSEIEALPFSFAPLPEQQRIVGILDEAFDGIATAKANAEQNLQNARALFESHLQSVFIQRGEGWVEKPLSELCDIKHGFAFKSEFFTSDGDYVLLTPGNFYESGGYRDRGEKQKYYVGEIPRDYVLNEGDLLVAMTEQAAGLLGSPILVPESDRFLHNQRLGLITKKSDVPWTNEFFFHVFNTQAVRKEIHVSASGVKVRHTSPTKIGEVVVSFPTSISEQRAIVATLKDLSEETQRLESLYQRKLAALDELKKSLLHQAFNGAL
ncbi:EcoKI restriction-modification system protein HsdS [mine drainage metagenome]|uniref:EcoKI restriction-modification system protein HsdS n=1 Tax=mine drainage metagenome TaxID=410659 RepID=A0A1J5TW83_9ZZZZ